LEEHHPFSIPSAPNQTLTYIEDGDDKTLVLYSLCTRVDGRSIDYGYYLDFEVKKLRRKQQQQKLRRKQQQNETFVKLNLSKFLSLLTS